jgi:hypothetical protein
MKNEKIIKHSYSNAELVKLKNKRVQIVSLPTEEYGIEFRILSEDLKPRAVHVVKKDKIVITAFKISKKSAYALMIALINQLQKDKLI